MRKLILFIFALFIGLGLFASCGRDADVASWNISQDADSFKIFRRVVFYNGITDKYILMVEGYCSIEVDSTNNKIAVIVKTDDGRFLKHYLGLSDNVTYFAEQMQPQEVSTHRYRVIFKPESVIPNVTR